MNRLHAMQEMLDVQRALQKNAYGMVPEEMDGEQRAQYVRDMVLACTDELHEALAETGWKPWASSRHLNRDAFVGELVDAWHFLMNLMLVAGVNEEEFTEKYMAKAIKNSARQKGGYDGVSSKCAECHRALDEVEQALVVQGGGMKFCKASHLNSYVMRMPS